MFDPTLPANDSPLVSAEMRGQLTGLKDLIDAVQSVTAVQVDGVDTLNPGDAANVSLSVIGSVLHFSFGIPRGFDGQPGGDGQPGPPFAQAVVDGVTTLNPGDNATVDVSFDGSNVRFQFGIPRGNDGGTGSAGEPGQPGEVTNADLSTAVSGTSTNSNGVSTLDTSFANDPPTLADLEVMRDKLNELINALRR